LKSIIAFFIGCILVSSPLLAADLTLEGNFKQGGLVLGTVTKGSLVSLDAKEVWVSQEGFFLLGFGRDAKPKSDLRITYPDGHQKSKTLDIAPHDYEVSRIDGLEEKKVTPDPIALERIRADNALIGQTRQKFTKESWFASGFDWPVRGRISGVFGSLRILNGKPRSPHKGLDIAAPEGTVIAADADGVISMLHQDMYLMGKAVMIDHGAGLQSVYIHMDEILVKEGQFVKKGEPVGKVGMTGRATGPHLHWGVSLNDEALDPQLLVK
jgi:murein DD-endopeptidase MepM/ murein hydrolase activator NlpD